MNQEAINFVENYLKNLFNEGQKVEFKSSKTWRGETFYHIYVDGELTGTYSKLDLVREIPGLGKMLGFMNY